ncbi:hypothetical protein ACTA71_005415 [Dictyostelium dimigraforme]
MVQHLIIHYHILCKCSGSIKYLHQNCLLEWIQHSKSSSCKLCGHRFRFTPRFYSPNAPEFIPSHELFYEALISIIINHHELSSSSSSSSSSSTIIKLLNLAK